MNSMNMKRLGSFLGNLMPFSPMPRCQRDDSASWRHFSRCASSFPENSWNDSLEISSNIFKEIHLIDDPLLFFYMNLRHFMTHVDFKCLRSAVQEPFYPQWQSNRAFGIENGASNFCTLLLAKSFHYWQFARIKGRVQDVSRRNLQSYQHPITLAQRSKKGCSCTCFTGPISLRWQGGTLK